MQLRRHVEEPTTLAGSMTAKHLALVPVEARLRVLNSNFAQGCTENQRRWPR